ncbi:MAG: ABC transporter permease [Chloroflexi bacterium]|nr:ABC transporter permease [Chloroflexota bacterium]
MRNALDAVGGKSRLSRIAARLPVETVKALLRHRLSVFGLTYIAIALGVAVFAGVLSPHDPNAIDPVRSLESPSWDHLLGLDDVGRDVFSRLLYGARVSIMVGVMAATLAVLVGVPLGILAAYAGGWTDHVIMRIVDAKIAIPNLLLAILLLLVLGGGVFTVSLALGLNLTTTQARLVRSRALTVKEMDYVLAARALGSSPLRILGLHVLPNAFQPSIVQATLGMGFAVLGEAGLSFLGIGVTIPTPTWGNMLTLAFQNMESAPWLSIAPGMAIFLLVLSFNFVGDGIRDVLDPRLRGRV